MNKKIDQALTLIILIKINMKTENTLRQNAKNRSFSNPLIA